MRTVVTLLSDRNKDLYPFNSPSKFTNILPSCIYPSRGLNRLYVRLLNACISAKTTKDGVAWIFLSEIEGNALIRPELNHCLGQVELSTDGSGSQYQEFDHASYHRVNVIPLFRLSVTLASHSAEQFEDGAAGGDLGDLRQSPTSITIEIMDEIEMGEHFEIVGHSLAEPEGPFPFNRLNDFTIPLPYELSLDDSWEMALTGVSLPAGLVYSTYHVAIEGVRYFIDVSGIGSIREMADIITQIFRECHLAGTFLVSLRASRRYRGRKAIFIMRRKLRPGEEDAFGPEGLLVEMSPELLRFLNPNNQRGFHARFKPGQDLMVTLEANEHLNKAPEYSPLALIYSDVVKPNAIGGSLKPLLQVMPMGDYLFKKRTNFFQPKNLIYKDVANKKLSSINIKLISTNDEIYPLDSETRAEIIIVTLKFRKKQNASQYL